MFKYRLCPSPNDKTATTLCHLIYSYESVLYLRDKIEFAYILVYKKTLFLFVKLERDVNALSLISFFKNSAQLLNYSVSTCLSLRQIKMNEKMFPCHFRLFISQHIFGQGLSEIQQSFTLLFVVKLRGIIFFRQLTVYK